ncbi:predicted protein [Postia placenta Mad-698-R]|nr:predicted protein [Postia placenta Mad-698-R]
MTADSASCQSPSPYVDLMLYDAWSYASRIFIFEKEQRQLGVRIMTKPYARVTLHDAFTQFGTTSRWTAARPIAPSVRNARPPGQAWHYNEVAECAFSLSRTSVRLQAFEMGAKNSLKVKIPAHNTAYPAVKNAHRGTVLGERKTITHCTARCAVTKLESVASNNCASKIIHRHSSSMNLQALRPALCPFRTLCHCDRMIDIQIAIGSGSPVRHISRLDDYGTSSALCGQRVENRVYSRE